MQVGWTYFLYNLRVYLEKHRGRMRRMISDRMPAEMPRAKFWKHLLSGAAGMVIGGTGAIKPGDRIELALGETGGVKAAAEIVIEDHALGLRIPDLGDALLFVELEGKGDAFSVGYWLSVYDEAQAKRVEPAARRAFRRIHDSMPQG
jgi:hypothetical protein